MGQAKRNKDSGALKLPRRFFALIFNREHRLAGQVARVQRSAAFFFRYDEARLVQINSNMEETTEIRPVFVKDITAMLAGETIAEDVKQSLAHDFERARLDKPRPAPKPKPTPADIAAAKINVEQDAKQHGPAYEISQAMLSKPEEAFDTFMRLKDQLDDIDYWRLLGILYVGATFTNENVRTWGELLGSDRGHRRYLMNPVELKMFDDMPGRVLCWRAHSPGEDYWFQYAINDTDKLMMMVAAQSIGCDRISDYAIHRDDVLACFTRRGALEVLCLDMSKAQHVGDAPLKPTEDAAEPATIH